jgi:hypothetical protein
MHPPLISIGSAMMAGGAVEVLEPVGGGVTAAEWALASTKMWLDTGSDAARPAARAHPAVTPPIFMMSSMAKSEAPAAIAFGHVAREPPVLAGLHGDGRAGAHSRVSLDVSAAPVPPPTQGRRGEAGDARIASGGSSDWL